MGILETVFIIFLILKLLTIGVVATWSWWMVLSPLLVALFLYAIMFIFIMYKHIEFKRKYKR